MTEQEKVPEPSDAPAGTDPGEALDRIMADRPAPGPEVAAALAEVEAARANMAGALDDLTGATQSALDIPAKIRRNPVKAAALVGGTGFLVAGGPRRLARFLGRRVLPDRPDPYEGLLPPEIEKVLADSKLARDPQVRRALEADFAEYLRSKGRVGPEPNAAASLWRTFDRLAGPLGTAGARIMVGRLMAAEQERADALAEARAARPRRSRGPAKPG